MRSYTVRFCGDDTTSSGQSNAFHTAFTEKIETTPRIGRDIGRMMYRSVRNGPAPSIAAAAMKSCGIESKKRLSRNMLNAFVTAGSQIAHGESSMCPWKTGRAVPLTELG